MIMKKISFLISILIIAGSLYAQHNYVGLSMGASVPFGTYSAEKSSNTTGYALPSFTLSFEADYSFSPYLSLSAIANYGMNGISEEELKNDLIAYFRELYPAVPSPLPPDAEVNFIINQWTYVNLMAGPTASLPVSSFIFQLRALAGLSFIMPPERDLQVQYSNTTLRAHSQGQSLKFGYLLGAGIIYKGNSRTGIRIGADYFSTNSVVELEHRYDDSIGPEDINSDEVEIPVTAMNITMGIVTYF